MGLGVGGTVGVGVLGVAVGGAVGVGVLGVAVVGDVVGVGVLGAGVIGVGDEGAVGVGVVGLDVDGLADSASAWVASTRKTQPTAAIEWNRARVRGELDIGSGRSRFRVGC